MQGAWPQAAGYSTPRNLLGMLLGLGPMSQLQPELLLHSLAPGWGWGAQL